MSLQSMSAKLNKNNYKKFKHKRGWIRLRRVDVQVCILIAIIVILSCSAIFTFNYSLTYNDMINDLALRTMSIHTHLDKKLDKNVFTDISDITDTTKESYIEMRTLLNDIKQATGVMYLYTATQNTDGEYVYLVDGLPLDALDFRYPGDLIEPEIVPDIKRAMDGELVLPNNIKSTDWGKIFITYLPIHENGQDGNVVGVIGIEFLASHQYYTYQALRISTPIIILLACLLCMFIAFKLFRRISNPTYQDMANTDYLTGLKNRNSYDTDLKNLENQIFSKDIGLISIDVNNLKLVNDKLGHTAGDDYILHVAESLKHANAHDFALYRFGGDEFIAIVQKENHCDMEDYIARAKKYFEETKPDWNIPITFSAGCAIFDSETDSDLHDTFMRADKNMYNQKKEFHNKNGTFDR